MQNMFQRGFTFKWTKNDVMKLAEYNFWLCLRCGLWFIQYHMLTGFYIHILKIISLYQWFPDSCHSYFWWYASHWEGSTEAAPDPALLEVLIWAIRPLTTSQHWIPSCSCLLQFRGTYWPVQLKVQGLRLKADFTQPPESGVRVLIAPSSLPCVCSRGRKEAKLEVEAAGRLSLTLCWVLCPGRCCLLSFTYTQM